MPGRRAIAIVAGELASPVAAKLKTAIAARGPLVRVLEMPGKMEVISAEDSERLARALELFTAEEGLELRRKGLLDSLDLQEVPVLFVLTDPTVGNTPALVAAHLIRESAGPLTGHEPLATKFRFVTVTLCPATLGAAEAHGAEIQRFWDEAIACGPERVRRRNPVILVCREFRGAPVAGETLVPVLGRLAGLLLAFEYDLRRGSFSEFWNLRHSSGGQFYAGLRTFRVENVSGAAAQLLCHAARDRILDLLEDGGGPRTSGLQWELPVADPGLVPGSAAWQAGVSAARDWVLSQVAKSLPCSGTISRLDAELKALMERQCVREEPVPEAGVPFALGVLLFGTAARTSEAVVVVALLLVAYFVTKRVRRLPPASPPMRDEKPPELQELQQDRSSGPYCEVLREMREALSRLPRTPQPAAPAPAVEAAEFDLQDATLLGASIDEILFKPEASSHGRKVAQERVCALGCDLLLLIAGLFVNGGWSAGKRAATLMDATTRALRDIESVIRQDFLLFARRWEAGSEVQSALFAPERRLDEQHRFCFRDHRLGDELPGEDFISAPDTIHYLYLVS